MTKPNLEAKFAQDRLVFLEEQIPLMVLKLKEPRLDVLTSSQMTNRLHEYKLEYKERTGTEYI